jgi:hypothetical protein
MIISGEEWSRMTDAAIKAQSGEETNNPEHRVVLRIQARNVRVRYNKEQIKIDFDHDPFHITMPKDGIVVLEFYDGENLIFTHEEHVGANMTYGGENMGPLIASPN